MNRVTVTIADRDYTFLTDGEAEFTQQVAQHVDEKLREVLQGRVALTDAAVLAAMNIAEEYFKEVETADNLRRQMKEYLDEASKLKAELSELKRENFRLQGNR